MNSTSTIVVVAPLPAVNWDIGVTPFLQLPIRPDFGSGEGRAGMGCHTPYANAPGAKCADTQIRAISLPESGEGTGVCGFGSMGVWRERRPRIPVRLEGGPREQEGQSDHQRDEG